MKTFHALALVLALCTASTCRADFIVSLSSPDDLMHLHVGQTITLNVSLSGVSPSNVLDSLGITVADPPVVFNTPTISAGAIVPDLSGFLTAPSPGVADATYDDLIAISGTPITTNGVFLSAQFTPTTTGSGTFDFTNISGFQGFDFANITNGTPDGLAFDVSPAGQTAPAPSSLLLTSLATILLGLRHLWSQRARRQSLAVAGQPGTSPHVPAMPAARAD